MPHRRRRRRRVADDAAEPPDPPHWLRKVILFLSGQTVSLLGSMLVQYAVFWYLTITYQSGIIMMLAALFGFLPQAVVSIFGGVWADRHNRKYLIIGADAAIAVSTLALALIMMAGYDAVWLIFLTMAIRSAGAGIQMPAVSALIPQITPTRNLMRVNGINGSIQSAMALLAPAAAGAIYAWSSASTDGAAASLVPIFFIDVVTAVIGIGLLALDPGRGRPPRGRRRRPGTSPTSSTACATSPTTRSCAGCWSLFAIIFVLTVAPSNLTPLMLVRSFDAGEQQNVVNLAVLEIAFSVGMVLGGIVVASLFAKRSRIGMIIVSSLVFGALSIGMGLSPNIWLFFGFMFLLGLVGAVLLDAVDDAAAGDRRARAAGARVRLPRHRDGARDADRHGRLRAARRRRADRVAAGRGRRADLRRARRGRVAARRPTGGRRRARGIPRGRSASRARRRRRPPCTRRTPRRLGTCFCATRSPSRTHSSASSR